VVENRINSSVPETVLIEPQTKNISSLEEVSQSKGRENLEKWEYMCNLIKDFKDKYNRIPTLKSNDQMEKVLARWLFLQKSCYVRHKMHPYHQRRLKEVGVKLSN
jgi:hypothetical protein